MTEAQTGAGSTTAGAMAGVTTGAAGDDHASDLFDFPRARRWPYLVVGAILGVGGTIAATMMLEGDDAAQESTKGIDLQLTTAPVEIRDLIEEVEWVADLGYGLPVDVAARHDGIVTATADVGTVLRRGDTLLEIDEKPVVLLYGDVPAWRDLAEGDEGPDVEQLETNLVALGYDPENTVTIDDTFTDNTEAMVERWQEGLGAEATGQITTADIVVVSGPVSVTTAPTVGASSRAGVVLARVSARAETTTVVGRQLGEITEVAAVGERVDNGTILYAVDDGQVTALTSLDAVGSLIVDPDTPAIDLEAVLVFEGYDPEGAIEADGVLDDATTAAIMRWQDANGLSATGAADASAYVVVPPDLQVSRQLVGPGDELIEGRPVVELSSQTLSVVIPVGLADQDDFVVDQVVQVELPDETVAAGVVVEVGTIARTAAPGVEPTIDVTVVFTELVDDDLPASEVTVVVAGETVENAMVVPTRALVTLAEGGFAVEKVLDDGQTILVAVQTGAFDDDVVAVESSQLEPGDELVVPQ